MQNSPASRSDRYAYYVDLILFKAYADLRVEAARTFAGFIWWIIEPLLSMLIYYVVFSVVLQRGTEDFVPYLLIGLVVWRWFETAIRVGSVSLLRNVALMRQVYIAKILFPTIDIVVQSFKFSVGFIVLLLFLWIYGFPVTLTYTALPLVLAVQFMLIVAITLPLCSILPFVPDLDQLISHVMRLAFFFSAIMYPVDLIPARLIPFFYANPMVSLIEAYRDVLMYHRWPNWGALGIIASSSVAGILIGRTMIRRKDHVYSQVII